GAADRSRPGRCRPDGQHLREWERGGRTGPGADDPRRTRQGGSVNRDLDTMSPEGRPKVVRDTVASVCQALDAGDRDAAEVNLMHCYHRGARAVELLEAVVEHIGGRR